VLVGRTTTVGTVAVRVGVAEGITVVPIRVAVGVDVVGTAVRDVAVGVRVRVAVVVPEVRVAVAVGTTTTATQPPVLFGQSLLSTHEKPSKSPPSQNFPVERQTDDGHCWSLTQENPLLSPARQTFCVPRQVTPPAQFVVTSPADTPLPHVPSVASSLHTGCALQLPAAQSQGKPSSSPPSQTPCAMTHTPPGQSSSELQATPSRVPAEHRNSPVGRGVGVWARVAPAVYSTKIPAKMAMQLCRLVKFVTMASVDV